MIILRYTYCSINSKEKKYIDIYDRERLINDIAWTLLYIDNFDQAKLAVNLSIYIQPLVTFYVRTRLRETYTYGEKYAAATYFIWT